LEKNIKGRKENNSISIGNNNKEQQTSAAETVPAVGRPPKFSMIGIDINVDCIRNMEGWHVPDPRPLETIVGPPQSSNFY
tara:strand:+ start:1956 stop:2195 length:240 start_codon:yes stop_codon:yes gene_type:complete